MQRLVPLAGAGLATAGDGAGTEPGRPADDWAPDGAAIVGRRQPQALFADETLGQALRQLVLYGPAGLPVISADGARVTGWVTSRDVVRAMAERIERSSADVAQGSLSAEFARPRASERLHAPSLPLDGYELVELRLTAAGAGRALGDVPLPPGAIAAAVTKGRGTEAIQAGTTLDAGDHLLVLVPAPRDGAGEREPAEARGIA
jgi:CIC family chloride channel protein